LSIGDNDVLKTMPDKVQNPRSWGFLAYWGPTARIRWDAQPAADKYEVTAYDKNGKEFKNFETIGNFCNEEFIADKNNEVYSFKVRAISTVLGNEVYGKWSDRGYVIPAPRMYTDTGHTLTIAKNGKLNFNCKKIKGCDGYKVYISTKEKSGYKCVKTLKGENSTSVVLKKFEGKKFNTHKTYYIYVEAYKKSGDKTFTSLSYECNRLRNNDGQRIQFRDEDPEKRK